MFYKKYISLYRFLHENAHLGPLYNSKNINFGFIVHFQKAYLVKFGMQWSIAALCARPILYVEIVNFYNSITLKILV